MAFVTAGIMSLRGGMPIRVNGEVVGAVGIAGGKPETDTEIIGRSGSGRLRGKAAWLTVSSAGGLKPKA